MGSRIFNVLIALPPPLIGGQFSTVPPLDTTIFAVKVPKIIAVGRNYWQIQTICRKHSQPAQIPRITYGYNKT